MKKTVREIARRKNLSANLPRYIDGMMGRYLEFSSVRLALNYHVFCDMQRENSTGVISDEVLSVFSQIMDGLPQVLNMKDRETEGSAAGIETDRDAEGSAEDTVTDYDPEDPAENPVSNRETEKAAGCSVESLLARTEDLRKSVTDRMQVLTAYTDIFHLYEYVLNRVEYRFREGSLPENYSDDAFCREIMKYIVRDEEPAEVNRKIGEILGQLPVRLTKQKFYELLDAGLSTYMGTDRSGLDDFLYMLRMSAMLEEPAQVSGEFAHLDLAKEEFRVCDYANITEEEYHRLADRMKETADYLNEASEQYTLLMEQLNDSYVILKACGAKAEAEDDVLTACEQIMCSSKEGRDSRAAFSQTVHGDDQEDTNTDVPEDTLDLLVSLEGVQERISEELGSYGYLVDDLNDGDAGELARLGFSEAFRDLKTMENLTSSSIFVDLNAAEEGEIAVDEDYIEQKKEILHRDIDRMFAENSRLVRRAVMATVISQLPVFFENLNSMQDFVYNSLAQCRDEAEKIACVEVISSILTDPAGAAQG